MLILKQLGFRYFFDAISDGNSIQYSKPHPEVFMKAADLLNIPYKECLVVEDAISGCFAAKNAYECSSFIKCLSLHFCRLSLNCFKELLDIKY